MPKWVYGFMQSKNRYRSEEELLDIAKKFRNERIPCDCIVIDWHWFKEFGDLTWDAEYWPTPEKMLKTLKQQGFYIVQAQHPYIDEQSVHYKEFFEKGYLIKNPKGKGRPAFDFSNPEAREAWWNEVKKLYEQGIRGYWIDMGELEQHPEGATNYLGVREKIHNVYSLLWSKSLFEGQRKDKDERVFILSRAGYAGIHRYGTALWSGDIDASWEVLAEQIIVGQGVCMSGIPYWTTDIGGFCTTQTFTPELYIRWFQWGGFCPLFRTHGTRPENEPWSFGELAKKIIKKYIEFRYRLFPYIYSCAREIAEKGTPIMKAMALSFPEDSVAVKQTLQIMFGPSILVAPVVQKGVRHREVYLPQGHIWYNYWTDEKYQGGQWITVQAPLEIIPLFVKEGSLLPIAGIKQYTGEEEKRNLQLHLYGEKQASFTLYEDDGITYEYEKGDYLKTILNIDENKRLTINKVDGNIKESFFKNYEIILHDKSGYRETDISLYLDHDITGEGVWDIYLTDLYGNLSKYDYNIKINVPNGWKIIKQTKMTWTLAPNLQELPCIHRGSMIIKINSPKENLYIVPINSF